MRRWLLLALVACTKRNPDVCCETDKECAAIGFNSPQPCSLGVCVANTCAMSGCDGDEDCMDPMALHCLAGACASESELCAAAGGRIAWISDRDGDPDLYVAYADGTNVVELTHNSAAESSPIWSPDGTSIA